VGSNGLYWAADGIYRLCLVGKKAVYFRIFNYKGAGQSVGFFGMFLARHQVRHFVAYRLLAASPILPAPLRDCMCTMSMIVTRFSLSFYVACWVLVLAGCSKGAFEIRDAWIAEAPPNVSAQAGYLTIDNATAKPMSLLSISSVAFETIQIHRSEHDEATGLVRMVHEKQADIPAHAELRFAPGGYHLMLMNPKLALKEGDQIAMDLLFADGTELDITFAVRRVKFTL
jgi:copper(I)-binding protein